MSDQYRIDGPITFRGAVYPWEADHLGHMNVQHYVGKFDEASWNPMALIGVDRTYMDGQNRALAAVEQHIRYFREVLVGDTLTVTSTVREIGGKVCRFSHAMTNNHSGVVAAYVDITAVHMDTEARNSCPIPDHIVRKAGAYLDMIP